MVAGRTPATAAAIRWNCCTPSACWRHLDERARGDQDQLRTTIAEELLTTHASRGRQALAAGDEDTARTHLRCLADCADSPTRLVEVLRTADIKYQHTVAEPLFDQLATLARNALHGWADDVLRSAQSARDDPAAIAGLPDGRPANYAGGIDRLTPFLRLGVPVRDMLRTGLEWYNSWRYDTIVQSGKDDAIERLTESATPLADALVPLCVQDDGLDPANQVLSNHFVYRGYTRDDEEAVPELEQALAWHPGNGNAQVLLSGAINRCAVKLVNNAVALEKPFATTVSDILDTVRTGMTAGALGAAARRPLHAVAKAECAKCGGRSSSGRRTVVAALIHILRATGRFESAGPRQFWADYRDFLCVRCATALWSMDEAHRKAEGMYERALELDPGNEHAAKNLAAIRSRA